MQSGDVFRQGMNLVDPFALPEQYSRLRGEAPISQVRCPGGMDAWLVTRHADVCAVLSDTRFSSRVALFDHLHGTLDQNNPFFSVFSRLDGAAHLRFRRALGPEFGVRRIRELTSRIEDIVTTQLDVMITLVPPVDLYRDFALPVTSAVIFELVGARREKRKWVQKATRLALDVGTPSEERMRLSAEFYDYMRDLIVCGRRVVKDDLLGRLIHGQADAAEPFTDEELATLGGVLLGAGFESTASAIGLSVLALLRHPQQLTALQANPEQTGRAVEELLRYVPVFSNGIARYAIEDIAVGDQQILAGEWVVTALASANRDVALCDRPDRLELTRNPTRHVAFGYGPHQCLGQLLARTEIEIALRELIRRFPELQLAVPFDQVPLRSNMPVFGVQTLPVVW